jgi:hypothetical protein
VILSFGEPIHAELAGAVHADLTAELSGRGIAVCPADAKPITLLASVQVDPQPGERMLLVVSDHATDKQVTRDVPLAHLPDNGRALAIAIAIDELLRASWAELSLAPEAVAAKNETAPAPVAAAPASTELVAPERKADKWLSLQGTYAAIPDRYRALGAQLTFDMLPWRALWFEVRLGAARAQTRDVGPGKVSIVALSSGATLGACLEATRVAVKSCLGASLNVDALRLSGKAEPGSIASDSVEPMLTSAATLGVLARFSERWSATGAVALGTVLSGIRITDDEANTLLALEGLFLTASLGLGVSL